MRKLKVLIALIVFSTLLLYSNSLLKTIPQQVVYAMDVEVGGAGTNIPGTNQPSLDNDDNNEIDADGDDDDTATDADDATEGTGTNRSGVEDDPVINIGTSIDAFNPVSDPLDGMVTEEHIIVDDLTEQDHQTIADWRSDVEIHAREQRAGFIRTLFMVVGFGLIGLAVVMIIVAMLGKVKGYGILKLFTLGDHEYYISFEESFNANAGSTITYLTPNTLLTYSIMTIILGVFILNGMLFWLIQWLMLLFIQVGEFFMEAIG